eukprot:m.699775 g.699775  ORF g.699775 m.699775 type:complete len:429 (-) comp22906_c0_seq19:2120-3406(-)
MDNPAKRIILLTVLICETQARLVNFEDLGAVPDVNDNATEWANGALLNFSLRSLLPGDTFLIPNKTFHVMGGIQAANIESVAIQLDGTLYFSNNIKEWPRSGSGHVHECLFFSNITNVTFTSSGAGTLYGNGEKWWGIPGIGYLVRSENRPRLFAIDSSQGLLVEKWYLIDSPYWTTLLSNVDGLEIKESHIRAQRDGDRGHDILDLTAFNTDGFDVTGNNVWIHDCTIFNQDDCIAVKDGSTNMLFERINASGLGLTIGSIGGSIVRNITFRDCYMDETVKGIYMKFRGGNGLIADVLYENIVMDRPEQMAIWIGPAQQADNRNICHPNPCSLCWPGDPQAQCNCPVGGSYRNITLRNITVNNPKLSPGVIMANESNPMTGVVFDGVRVISPGNKPWGDKFYACQGVSNGLAIGGTYPIPPCFTNHT